MERNSSGTTKEIVLITILELFIELNIFLFFIAITLNRNGIATNEKHIAMN
jgi:hypothetical protein